jgi:hypothetical protein
MENTLKQNERFSVRDIAYYRRRHQNRLFSALAQFFATEAEHGRITRKEIAARLSKDPAQITRWLSGPTNFEADTISDILLAMGAEMDYSIVRFSDRPKPNYAHPLSIITSARTTQGYATTPQPQKVQSSGTLFQPWFGAQATDPVFHLDWPVVKIAAEIPAKKQSVLPSSSGTQMIVVPITPMERDRATS